MKVIQRFKHSKVYRNAEYEEYIVRFYDLNGKHMVNADYHTDCKADAIVTAGAWTGKGD